MESRSSVSRSAARIIGDSTTGRPVSSTTSKNGGYAGVGTTTPLPGSTNTLSAVEIALSTSATGKIRAGGTTHPYCASMNAAHAVVSAPRSAST
jgi:hypothetical protein